MSRPAVFLDRDGVIVALAPHSATGDWESAHGPEAVRLVPGAAECIARLQRAGRPVLVVSNQPSAAKGKCTTDGLERVHRRVVELLAAAGARADGWYYCRHHPEGRGPLGQVCECRKPAPGLVLQAGREWEVDLAGSWLVGDRPSDVECGRRAGCRTILVRGGQPERGPAGLDVVPDHIAADLAAATELILQEDPSPCQR